MWNLGDEPVDRGHIVRPKLPMVVTNKSPYLLIPAAFKLITQNT